MWLWGAWGISWVAGMSAIYKKVFWKWMGLIFCCAAHREMLFPLRIRHRGQKTSGTAVAGVWCIYGSRARDLFRNLWILSTLPSALLAYFLSLCFLSLFVRCGSRTCGFTTIHSSSSNEWYDIWNRNDSCSRLIKTFLPRKLSLPNPCGALPPRLCYYL